MPGINIWAGKSARMKMAAIGRKSLTVAELKQVMREENVPGISKVTKDNKDAYIKKVITKMSKQGSSCYPVVENTEKIYWECAGGGKKPVRIPIEETVSERKTTVSEAVTISVKGKEIKVSKKGDKPSTHRKKGSSAVEIRERKESIASMEKIIAKMEREAKELKAKNHPRLYKEKMEEIKKFKGMIDYQKKMISNLTSGVEKKPEIIIERTPGKEPSYYDVKVPRLIDFDKAVMDVEGYGPESLRPNQYEVLLFMAKKGGKIHAIDADFIAQRGRMMKSSPEQIYLWVPLTKSGLVVPVRMQPRASQEAFFQKSKSGYTARAAAGMEPSTHSITVYRLTDDGWEKANQVVKMIRNFRKGK